MQLPSVWQPARHEVVSRQGRSRPSASAGTSIEQLLKRPVTAPGPSPVFQSRLRDCQASNKASGAIDPVLPRYSSKGASIEQLLKLPVVKDELKDSETSSSDRVTLDDGGKDVQTSSKQLTSLDTEAVKVQRVFPKLSCGIPHEQVYCVRFSPDDRYFAASFDDGSIDVYQITTGRRYNALTFKPDGIPLPTTQICWRPVTPNQPSASSLVAVGSDGHIRHWQVFGKKIVSDVVNASNELLCVSYRPDAMQFATAGKRPEVFVYDEATRKRISALAGGDVTNTPGHSNRIFSLKYHPCDPNIIISGSWDRMLQCWDVRAGMAVRAIFGPYICGDSIDISRDGKSILTGSYVKSDQLQIWDYGTLKLSETIRWESSSSNSPSCRLYAAQFSKIPGCSLIAAGGSGPDEFGIYDRVSSTWVYHKALSKPCASIDFANKGPSIVVASGDGSLDVIDVWTD